MKSPARAPRTVPTAPYAPRHSAETFASTYVPAGSPTHAYTSSATTKQHPAPVYSSNVFQTSSGLPSGVTTPGSVPNVMSRTSSVSYHIYSAGQFHRAPSTPDLANPVHDILQSPPVYRHSIAVSTSRTSMEASPEYGGFTTPRPSVVQNQTLTRSGSATVPMRRAPAASFHLNECIQREGSVTSRISAISKITDRQDDVAGPYRIRLTDDDPVKAAHRAVTASTFQSDNPDADRRHKSVASPMKSLIVRSMMTLQGIPNYDYPPPTIYVSSSVRQPIKSCLKAPASDRHNNETISLDHSNQSDGLDLSKQAADQNTDDDQVPNRKREPRNVAFDLFPTVMPCRGGEKLQALYI